MGEAETTSLQRAHGFFRDTVKFRIVKTLKIAVHVCTNYVGINRYDFQKFQMDAGRG